MFRFPLTSIKNTSKVTFRSLKKGTLYDLLDSENNAGLINYDSSFSILRANREVFEQR